jgi:uncharacterized Zn finger protein (UPF0148 family)
MNCTECGSVLPDANGVAICAACAREDAMYAAFARSVDVPPMWEAIERETRTRQAPWRVALAAAAAIALLMLGAIVLRRVPASRETPVIVAATHYRDAIARLERHARGDEAALLPQLSGAVRDAESAAVRAPDDAEAVTRVVAAYDAKLQMLRRSGDD